MVSIWRCARRRQGMKSSSRYETMIKPDTSEMVWFKLSVTTDHGLIGVIWLSAQTTHCIFTILNDSEKREALFSLPRPGVPSWNWIGNLDKRFSNGLASL